MTSLVGFAKIYNNTTDRIRQSIHESLEAIGYSFDKRIRTVVIKPNMCYYWDYSTGQTTDPRFVEALVDLIRQETPVRDISIIESDASAMKCKHAFKILGYEKLSRDHDVKLVNLSEDEHKIVDVIVGKQKVRIIVPQTILKADMRIDVPKIKYAIEGIKITCALKNIFGCNPYPKKFRYHPDLERVIVACNKAMRFNLCLVDGNIVSGIESRRLGLTIAGQDLVAIDAAVARIAGVNPKRIGYLQLAKREGLGDLSFVAKGADIDYFAKRFPRKTVGYKLRAKAFTIVTKSGLGRKLGLE